MPVFIVIQRNRPFDIQSASLTVSRLDYVDGNGATEDRFIENNMICARDTHYILLKRISHSMGICRILTIMLNVFISLSLSLCFSFPLSLSRWVCACEFCQFTHITSSLKRFALESSIRFYFDVFIESRTKWTTTVPTLYLCVRLAQFNWILFIFRWNMLFQI